MGSGSRVGPAISDTQVAKALVTKGLVTQEEVARCRVLKEKLARKDQRKSLLEILISEDCVTASQAQRVTRSETEAVNIAQIPGYQIIEKLGQGSMGVVYKAKQLSMDRIVAIKVLQKQLAMNKEFITRFEREARLAAKLNNSHLVQGIDVGETQGYRFFVMEYVEGTSVKDELDTGKVFEETEALEIVLQVADAMQHALERGLIHRDIKPDNIIKTTQGIVKLADLGLARQVSDQKLAMTEAGVAVGTPYYISPEQIRGEVDVDIRTDIYSLGATLYHMVTGKVPFEGDNPTVVMRRHLKDPLVPPDHINTKLSNGLGEVVETMMAKNVDQRYASPTDLLMDLESLSRGDPPVIARERLAQDTLQSLAAGSPDEDDDELAAAQPEVGVGAGPVGADELKTFLLVATVSLALLSLIQLVL